MEAKPSVAVSEGRGELAGPVDATVVDDHHHLFAALAKDTHD